MTDDHDHDAGPSRHRRAYVVFATAGPESPTLDLSRWRQHRNEVVTARSESDDLPPPSAKTFHAWRRRALADRYRVEGVVWRLFSSVHRDLGCSAEVSTRFENAREAAQDVADSVGLVRIRRVQEAATGSFSWFAVIAGRPVLVANRWWRVSWERDVHIERVHRALARVDVATSLEDLGRGNESVRTRAAVLQGPTAEDPVTSPIRELPRRRYPVDSGRIRPLR